MFSFPPTTWKTCSSVCPSGNHCLISTNQRVPGFTLMAARTPHSLSLQGCSPVQWHFSGVLQVKRAFSCADNQSVTLLLHVHRFSSEVTFLHMFTTLFVDLLSICAIWYHSVVLLGIITVRDTRGAKNSVVPLNISDWPIERVDLVAQAVNLYIVGAFKFKFKRKTLRQHNVNEDSLELCLWFCRFGHTQMGKRFLWAS